MHTRISQVLQCLILRSRLLQLLFLTTHTLAANTGKNAQWTCNACERMDWILTPLESYWLKFFPMHFGPSILETWHHSDVKQQQIQQIRTAWSLKGLKHPARNSLCQKKIMLVRCGQRSISCCSWSACATACKKGNIYGKWTNMMDKYDFQILSVAFDHGIWINLDKYGTFAESFAAIWSSFSKSITRAEAADSCSTNCLNSSSSKLASLSTDSTDPYCYFHRIQTNLLIVQLNYS